MEYKEKWYDKVQLNQIEEDFKRNNIKRLFQMF